MVDGAAFPPETECMEEKGTRVEQQALPGSMHEPLAWAACGLVAALQAFAAANDSRRRLRDEVRGFGGRVA